MEITLRSYHPFALSKSLDNYLGRQWMKPATNLLDLSRKVALLALGNLALLSVLVVDLVMTAVSLAYRACCRISSGSNISKIEPPIPLHLEADQADLKDNVQFMKRALRVAFRFLDPKTSKLYNELIQDQGIPPQNCKEYVDIFQWSAGAYFIHFLRHSSERHDLSKIYPNNHPELDARMNAIQELQRHVRGLVVAFNLKTNEEKNKIANKIFFPPKKIRLSEDEKTILNKIQAIALQMTQDPYFIRHIYTPATMT